jgi:hypothetical protein
MEYLPEKSHDCVWKISIGELIDFAFTIPRPDRSPFYRCFRVWVKLCLTTCDEDDQSQMCARYLFAHVLLIADFAMVPAYTHQCAGDLNRLACIQQANAGRTHFDMHVLSACFVPTFQ